MKTCSACGAEKEESCFAKKRAQCKTCRLAMDRHRMATNPESKRKSLETGRRSHARTRERRLDAQRKHYQANREWFRERTRKTTDSPKIKASQMVLAAVRKHELIRPEQCSVCGRTGRVEGHHCDYTKPLEVTWVCRGCHAAIHRRLRDEGAAA